MHNITMMVTELSLRHVYGRIAEHKAVVFEVLDINTIPKNCQIHHRDCNPLNNMPENLVLLSNSDHRWLHHQFGNATLYAYYYGKVSLDALCDWSNNPSKARTLLNLNILQQAAVLKSGELLESPQEDHQQPSLENSIEVSKKVQRLTGEELHQ